MLGRLLDQFRDRRRRTLLSPKLASGRRGEDLAHRFLRKEGYAIVARNYRLASGDAEADLIARDGDDVVIVEVKTRETDAYGPPDRAVGPDKLRHMMRVAREYSRKANVPMDRMRLDVVTVTLSPLHIELYKGSRVE